jgi:nicotinate-nucleotide adenylyltransferase
VTPGRFGDDRRVRIGLLGGSFNPAHEGHRHVAELARRRLRLDQVWLLVSPGNPLKPRAGMAPFAERLKGARRIADGRRVLATGIEAELGTRYTVDTLRLLRRRFRHARFCLVVGADILAELPRWRRWKALARRTPLAVLPRPGHTRRALAGAAAHFLSRWRRHGAARLMAGDGGAAGAHAPWCLVAPVPEHAASATAIRAAAARATGRTPDRPTGRTPDGLLQSRAISATSRPGSVQPAGSDAACSPPERMTERTRDRGGGHGPHPKGP